MSDDKKEDKVAQGMAVGIAGDTVVGLVLGPTGVIVGAIIGGLIGAAGTKLLEKAAQESAGYPESSLSLSLQLIPCFRTLRP